MRIKCFRVENFRRLKNARVDLETDRTIFVGANNCGKTSATHLFQMFLRSDGHANPHRIRWQLRHLPLLPCEVSRGGTSCRCKAQRVVHGSRYAGVRGSEMRSYDRCRGHLYVPCFPLTRTQSTKLRLPVQTRFLRTGCLPCICREGQCALSAMQGSLNSTRSSMRLSVPVNDPKPPRRFRDSSDAGAETGCQPIRPAGY